MYLTQIQASGSVPEVTIASENFKLSVKELTAVNRMSTISMFLMAKIKRVLMFVNVYVIRLILFL